MCFLVYRGSRTLLDGQGHKLTKKNVRKKDGGVVWRCTVRGGSNPCCGTVLQLRDTFTSLKPHSCQPKINLNENVLLNVVMKEAALNSRYQSSKTVAEEVLLQHHDANAKIRLPNVDTLARVRRRKRNQNFPSPPKDINFSLDPDDFPPNFIRADKVGFVHLKN